MPTAIQISQVHKHYQDNHALKGVSFDIQQGEFFGLLGPNGAGKSTLIGIIAGLARMDSGKVHVMGHDVERDYRQARRCLGVVPQELVFDPFFTVREILEIQAGYFGKKRQSKVWISQLLEGLNLADKASSNMRTLSGGMKRRVLIAQALVHRPDVVILDEPTAGVDVELRSSLWEFVKQLNNEGHTIVLTTHYLEEAEALCDRIGIVNKGELITLEDKNALLARGIGGQCTLNITFGQSGLSDCAIGKTVIGEGVDVISVDDCGMVVHFDKRSVSVMGVLDKVRMLGVDIADIRLEESDLEDIFIELTR